MARLTEIGLVWKDLTSGTHCIQPVPTSIGGYELINKGAFGSEDKRLNGVAVAC